MPNKWHCCRKVSKNPDAERYVFLLLCEKLTHCFLSPLATFLSVIGSDSCGPVKVRGQGHLGALSNVFAFRFNRAPSASKTSAEKALCMYRLLAALESKKSRLFDAPD